jgi:hypothetical protein
MLMHGRKTDIFIGLYKKYKKICHKKAYFSTNFLSFLHRPDKNPFSLNHFVDISNMEMYTYYFSLTF